VRIKNQLENPASEHRVVSIALIHGQSIGGKILILNQSVMKTRAQNVFFTLALLALATLNSQFSTAFAQGTAFTYQGQLVSGSTPASGSYDVTFSLFNANASGVAIAGPVTNTATAVSNGLFTTTVDFGTGVFTGTSYWLEIAVRTNGGGAFTTLSPRQPVLPTPYAIYSVSAENAMNANYSINAQNATAALSANFATTATTAGSANSVSATNITGTVQLTQLPGTILTNNESGVNLTGAFTGNGGGLTNLNAAQLTSIGNTNGGSYNFFAGSPAGNSSTSGTGNTAIGSQALVFNTSGSANTALGENALNYNASGTGNTAIGSQALTLNTGGSGNTALGVVALIFNTSGSDNTANGGAALYYNTNGSYNTANGYQALYASTSGSNNIALGYQAGYNLTTGSSNIDIGNPGTSGDNNIIRIGTSQTQTYLAGVVNGNGGGLTNLNAASMSGSIPSASLTSVPAASLTSIGNTNGGSGNFFLGSAGNTTTSGAFNTANGFDALLSNTSGSGNTANGYQALLFNSSGSNNIALGQLAGYNITTGSSNIDIGNKALSTDTNIIRIGSGQSQTFIAGVINGNGGGLTNLNAAQLFSIGNTNGGNNYNFFVGSSGNSTTSGDQNTAIGYLALTSITSGNFNTAIGGGALNGNTGGSENTAIGDGALSVNTNGDNTAVGYVAIGNNASGAFNTAVGNEALSENASGGFNTAIGDGALANLGEGSAGGSDNIALGYNAGFNYYFSESNNIDIGYAGNEFENDIIHIGTPGIQTNTFIAGVINGNGGGLTNLNAAKLSSGTIPLAQLPSQVVTNNSTSLTLNGTFNGNGFGLTNLNASQLTSIGNTNGGFSNFFIGSAGNSTTSGSVNTAVGFDALIANTSGSYNTANGVAVLNQNTSGSYNTAIGNGALVNNMGGSYNTANGYWALEINLSGSNNIALGYEAGYNIVGSSNIDIGNLGVFTDTNIIRIGTPGIQTNTFIAGVINGNGGGLTNLNAAQLTGALPAISGASLTSLPANAALLDASSQTFTGRNSFNQGIGVGTTSTLEGNLNVNTNTYLFSHPIYLRGEMGTDHNHGLAYNGNTVTNFGTGNVQVDGPVLWGFSGGALAVMNGGAHAVLTWTNGGVSVTGGFAFSSDRNMKTGFAALNPQEVLARVAALPMSSWFYKTDTDARHVGPMAQDFHAAFALGGGDDKHINVGDEGGVALAAIQGLNQKLNEKDAEIKALQQSVAELKQLVQTLAEKK